MVYCGLYPIDSSKYNDLRDALEKITVKRCCTSIRSRKHHKLLGFGFRWILGLLHMGVIQERLEREFDLDLITTAPSVIYHVQKTDGTEVVVSNPAEMPDQSSVQSLKNHT